MNTLRAKPPKYRQLISQNIGYTLSTDMQSMKRTYGTPVNMLMFISTYEMSRWDIGWNQRLIIKFGYGIATDRQVVHSAILRQAQYKWRQ